MRAAGCKLLLGVTAPFQCKSNGSSPTSQPGGKIGLFTITG
jgi:hypothetical protein